MEKAAESTMHDHVSIEYWGIGGEEGALYRGGVNGSFSESSSDALCLRRALTRYLASHGNNTYKGMRTVSPQYDLLYTVWCSHEHELYDMKVKGTLSLLTFLEVSHLLLITMGIDLDRPLPNPKSVRHTRQDQWTVNQSGDCAIGRALDGDEVLQGQAMHPALVDSSSRWEGKQPCRGSGS